MHVLAMLPEALVFAGALMVLIVGSYLPRRRLWWTRVIAVAALIGALIAGAVQMAGSDSAAFAETFVVDSVTGVARVIAPLATVLVILVAGEEISGSARESESYALLLSATAGVLVLAGAQDLLVLAVGFLLASIPLYALIGMGGSPAAAEAAMKTYLLGALSGILLLLGITLLFGGTGITAYGELRGLLTEIPAPIVVAGSVGVVAGLLFKAGGVPLHFWVPDAAQGAQGFVVMFVTTVPKIGAVIALYRLVAILPAGLAWPGLIGGIAVASMTLGNLAAFWQDDPRRLLGWSTVSQVGFLLVPVAAAGRSDLALPAMLFYLAGYTVTNIAAFAVTTAVPDARELSAYRGIGRTQPWLTGALIVALLGLLGTPPLALFVGKLTTASAAWESGAAWLAIAVFVNTLLSLFYYLRWIVPCLQTSVEVECSVPQHVSARVAVAAAVFSVAMGLAAGLVFGVVG
ncbi:NADH-quinone oxidoreductase subunit N [Mycolicibacterium sp. 3033]|nr:NADH-quinone oxidoreductase subunit N [Mycolicibacterium aurantiacum]